MMVRKEEKAVLCDLASQVGEIAQSERYSRLRRQWKLHNDMKQQQAPMVLIYPDQDGVWSELIPQSRLQCSDPFLRTLEFNLRQKLYRAEYFRDDFVIEADVLVEIPGIYTGHHYGKHDQKRAWGLKLIPEAMTDAHGSYAFAPVLNKPEDYERFFSHTLDFIVDEDEFAHRKEILDTLFPDSFRIKWELPYVALVCSLVIELVHLRGLQNIYLDLYDDPDLLMRVFSFMGEQKAELLDKLEKRGLLILNNEDHWTGSGGVGYSDELVYSDSTSLGNLWGFADAQEFSEVSIEMWKDFVLDNQAPALRKFGYSCYGCCEALNGKYEILLNTLHNLRRVSVSPWADEKEAAEAIGNNAIYSRKPNPSEICFGFDEHHQRKKLEDLMILTKDCYTEIILKDLRSCNSDPRPLSEWVDLAMRITKGV